MGIELGQIWTLETSGECAEEELLELIRQKMNGPAYAYAALDYAVAFGRYENGAARLALQNDAENAYELQDLPLSYTQEARIFRQDAELRAVRCGEFFRWRLKRDFGKADGQGDSCRVLDETHKLWGAAAAPNAGGVKDLPGEWSLLASGRGSAIAVPIRQPQRAELGLSIRNYIHFAKAAEENGILRFTDERLLGFAPWPPAEKKEAQRR